MKTAPDSAKNNNFTIYLVLLIGFFILLFFTKNIYGDLQVAQDANEQYTSELQIKQSELERLNEIQSTLSVEWSEDLILIEPFISELTPPLLFEYIYSYAKDTNLWNERMIIRDIFIEDGIQSDTWFTQANITINTLFSSERTMFNFVDYMVGDGQKYKFYLWDFSYPMNETTWNIQISIPFTIYYK